MCVREREGGGGETEHNLGANQCEVAQCRVGYTGRKEMGIPVAVFHELSSQIQRSWQDVVVLLLPGLAGTSGKLGTRIMAMSLGFFGSLRLAQELHAISLLPSSRQICDACDACDASAPTLPLSFCSFVLASCTAANGLLACSLTRNEKDKEQEEQEEQEEEEEEE